MWGFCGTVQTCERISCMFIKPISHRCRLVNVRVGILEYWDRNIMFLSKMTMGKTKTWLVQQLSVDTVVQPYRPLNQGTHFNIIKNTPRTSRRGLHLPRKLICKQNCKYGLSIRLCDLNTQINVCWNSVPVV